MAALLNLAGQRFGRLLVIERASNADDGGPRWLCRCDCGQEAIVRRVCLRSGMTKSCGCLRSEVQSARTDRSTHGLSGSPEFKTWQNVLSRCENPLVPNYHLYGGRGIKVCARWRDSFENFYADMGPRPSSKHSIDRENNDGNYEPGNCRWATKKEQGRNKRTDIKHGTRLLTVGGITKSIAAWAEETGLRWSTIDARMRRGWRGEDVIAAGR